MPGLYSRVKNWVDNETLTHSDLNAEFDNQITNHIPTMMDDYSATVGQMQTQTDPGEVGSESQPTNLAAELERLRFAIAELKGETYWYTTADSTIAELTSALGGGLPNNRIISGASSANSSNPLFLDPAISSGQINLLAATTNLVYSIEGTQYTISSDINASGLTAAPSSNNTALANNSNYADEKRD